MTILTETLTLANGHKIPLIALGTWQMSPEEAEHAVSFALKNDYIHIDTARTYGNEEGVARGIKASNVNREDFFLTTKVDAFSKTYAKSKQDIETSLKALETDYLDLVIIHAPRPWDQMFTESPIENHFFEENLEVWRAMEETYEAGQVKAIGVSNFSIGDLENLMTHAKVKPMLNQIRYHIGYRDEALIQYCQEHDMIVEAYSPIGTGRLLSNESIKQVAEHYGKSVAQVAIRYCYQKGLVVLPKSVHEQYMLENAAIDFDLSVADMDFLNRMLID